jgi:hypothetical protein
MLKITKIHQNQMLSDNIFYMIEDNNVKLLKIKLFILNINIKEYVITLKPISCEIINNTINIIFHELFLLKM